jgi:hypothetical protein
VVLQLLAESKDSSIAAGRQAQSQRGPCLASGSVLLLLVPLVGDHYLDATPPARTAIDPA